MTKKIANDRETLRDDCNIISTGSAMRASIEPSFEEEYATTLQQENKIIDLRLVEKKVTQPRDQETNFAMTFLCEPS